jgi:hypothetical protein
LAVKYVTGNVAKVNENNNMFHNVSKVFLVQNAQNIFDAE